MANLFRMSLSNCLFSQIVIFDFLFWRYWRVRCLLHKRRRRLWQDSRARIAPCVASKRCGCACPEDLKEPENSRFESENGRSWPRTVQKCFFDSATKSEKTHENFRLRIKRAAVPVQPCPCPMTVREAKSDATESEIVEESQISTAETGANRE